MRPDELFAALRPYHYYYYGTSESPVSENSLLFEFAFWVVVLLLTFIFLKARPSFFQKIESYGKSLSRRRGLAVVSVVFTALALRAVLLLVIPIPDPVVHDEYSYLLQGATFASGRLTNPTPAGWEHFETFHVNMRPTYQSMYPPGQALFLAAAEILHVHPWWGVWASVGIMCGAVCWMLQGWMPPPWALLGGLFCVLRFATFSYWINSYWGGAVAAIGGALVFGSLPRLRRTPKARYSLIFGLGLAILANTRPYEGLIVSIPALVALALWFLPAWRRKQVRISILVPAATVLLCVVAAMGYYNWRSTGNLMLMPYVVNQKEYHVTKPFIWQTAFIPKYRHEVMRIAYVRHELPDYLSRRYPSLLWDKARLAISIYYNFFIWPFMIPLVFATWNMMKSSKLRVLPITLLLLLGGLLLEQWSPSAHYGAPAVGVALVVLIRALRLVRTLKYKEMPIGLMLARTAVLALLAILGVAIGRAAIDPYHQVETGDALQVQLERARIMAELGRSPGQHLIFVHFHPREIPMIFWIYNDPDLSSSKVIWAHDMGSAANRELIRLYPNRHVWFLDKDDVINKLVPYPDHTELDASLHAASQEAVPHGQ